MSPDKRQTLPKHWFPIDFSLIQPYLPSSLFHCFLSPVIFPVLSLYFDPTPTGSVGHLTQKEFLKHSAKKTQPHPFRDWDGPCWKVGLCFLYSIIIHQLAHTQTVVKIYLCALSIDRAGCSEHHATDVMTTWRETAPSIILWSPDDRSRVCRE